MFHHFMIQEAIHSVAIEHARRCDCTVCRAADGDRQALGEVYGGFETRYESGDG